MNNVLTPRDVSDIPPIPRISYAPVFKGNSVMHSVGDVVSFATLRDAILAKAAAMAELESNRG